MYDIHRAVPYLANLANKFLAQNRGTALKLLSERLFKSVSKQWIAPALKSGSNYGLYLRCPSSGSLVPEKITRTV